MGRQPTETAATIQKRPANGEEADGDSDGEQRHRPAAAAAADDRQTATTDVEAARQEAGRHCLCWPQIAGGRTTTVEPMSDKW